MNTDPSLCFPDNDLAVTTGYIRNKWPQFILADVFHFHRVFALGQNDASFYNGKSSVSMWLVFLYKSTPSPKAINSTRSLPFNLGSSSEFSIL